MLPSASGLTLHHHRDATATARWLVDKLAAHSGGPFERPVVLAPHQALQRHLSLAVARATGVVASVRMVTPSGYIEEILGLEGSQREWRPEAMSWAIVAAIRANLSEMPQAVANLITTNDVIPLVQLARTIARRFRAYLFYRPSILEAWERGHLTTEAANEHQDWQRKLWMALLARDGVVSPLTVLRAARDESLKRPETLPSVVYIVSDPAMPPTIRTLVLHLAKWTDVRWSVIHYAPDAPHRLLSDRNRAAIANLRQLGLQAISQEVVDSASLLGRVQRAYTDNAELATGPHDETLSLHRCFSSLREIETLRELALQALESDSTLRPHDITLYVTALPEYLPSIELVFGVQEAGRPHLPFSVAGRPFRSRSPVIAAFLQLLEVSESRASLRDVSALLAMAPIAGAAGLTLEEASIAVRLVRDAGVHWGWDGAERAQRYDVPQIAGGTWTSGVDRLVLGLATGVSERDIGGIVPQGSDTATHAMIIDRLVDWTESLSKSFESWRIGRPAADWPAMVDEALRRYVKGADVEDARAARTIREAVDRICASMQMADAHATCDISILREALESGFADGTGVSGHLRGGVRVCQLEPGTILPSAVVLVAGMGDDHHPKGTSSVSWDLLIATNPKNLDLSAEDPDGRAESMSAFRELVCSAQKRLHVAWTGRTLSRHEKRAESVSVNELLEIAKAVTKPEHQRQLVRDEPAHPFSQRLFGAAGAANLATDSSSTNWATAARHLAAKNRPEFRFAGEMLPSLAPVTRIRLESLAECIQDPTRYYCRRVLGIRFPEDALLPEHEPLYADDNITLPSDDIGTDSKGTVGEMFRPMSYRLLNAQRRGDIRTKAEVEAWIRAQPEVPLGAAGADAAEHISAVWWERIEEARAIAWQEPREVRCSVGHFEIVGRIDRLVASGRNVIGLYEVRPHSAIEDWVRHLVLNIVSQNDQQSQKITTFIAPEQWALGAVPDAASHLLALCELFKEAHRAPIPFFKRTASMLLEGKKPDKERAEARNSWQGWHTHGKRWIPGEQETAWHRLCWPGREVFEDDEFYSMLEQRGRAVMGPLLESRIKRAGSEDEEPDE